MHTKENKKINPEYINLHFHPPPFWGLNIGIFNHECYFQFFNEWNGPPVESWTKIFILPKHTFLCLASYLEMKIVQCCCGRHKHQWCPVLLQVGVPGWLKWLFHISFFSNLIFSQTSYMVYESTVITWFSHLLSAMMDNWFQRTPSFSVIHYTWCRFIHQLFLQCLPSLQIYSPFLQPGGDVRQRAARQTLGL